MRWLSLRKDVKKSATAAKRKTATWKAEYAEMDEELALIGDVPMILTEAQFRSAVVERIKASYDAAVERVVKFKAEIESASPRQFIDAFEWGDSVVKAGQIVIVLGELLKALEGTRSEDFTTVIDAVKSKIRKDAEWYLKQGGSGSSSPMHRATKALSRAADAQILGDLHWIMPLVPSFNVLVLLDGEAQDEQN